MQWISRGKDTAKQREDLGNWKIQSLLVCVGNGGLGVLKPLKSYPPILRSCSV